jgi:hypothetical protein
MFRACLKAEDEVLSMKDKIRAGTVEQMRSWAPKSEKDFANKTARRERNIFEVSNLVNLGVLPFLSSRQAARTKRVGQKHLRGVPPVRHGSRGKVLLRPVSMRRSRRRAYFQRKFVHKMPRSLALQREFKLPKEWSTMSSNRQLSWTYGFFKKHRKASCMIIHGNAFRRHLSSDNLGGNRWGKILRLVQRRPLRRERRHPVYNVKLKYGPSGSRKKQFAFRPIGKKLTIDKVVTQARNAFQFRPLLPSEKPAIRKYSPAGKYNSFLFAKGRAEAALPKPPVVSPRSPVDFRSREKGESIKAYMEARLAWVHADAAGSSG